MIQANLVVLRDVRSANDYRFLSAEIKDDGDLLFQGQDIGEGVKAVFGYVEYEWAWTIKAKDVTLLIKAMGKDGNILELLHQNFSDENAANLYQFMESNGVPFESWSRVGD